MLPRLRCIFAHFLILQYPDHHQNLISSSLYYSGPVHKISSQSVHNLLSNVHRQTNKQTNQRYQKHNLLCQGGKDGEEGKGASRVNDVIICRERERERLWRRWKYHTANALVLCITDGPTWSIRTLQSLIMEHHQLGLGFFFLLFGNYGAGRCSSEQRDRQTDRQIDRHTGRNWVR